MADDAHVHNKTVVFLHPDLGIGGAERLVVDAAVGLQKRGHKVVIFTSHCDPSHCFDEARDGTLDVRVRGNTIVPPSILGRFSILCAILRQLHLIITIYFSSELGTLKPTTYFVDQLSAGLPLLQYIDPKSRIFFYCHFPDLLLVQGRQKWWKRAYRVPFDLWEQWSMSFADAIAVNSNFTKGVVSKTWPVLASRKELLTVYPCVSTETTPPPKSSRGASKGGSQAPKDDDADVADGKPLWGGKKFVLSINRFERKKDIALAIRAFASLPATADASPQAQHDKPRLVIAGGYDPRVAENVAYHQELCDLAEGLHLKITTAKTMVTALTSVRPDVDVLFLLSVPNVLKRALLRSAALLVYTPANEHFGIVPLEAMLQGVPVLAADSGGPVETVVEGVTGWHRSPGKVGEWAEVMGRVLRAGEDDGGLDRAELDRMAAAGRERVRLNFSEEKMAQRLDDIFDGMIGVEDPPRPALRIPGQAGWWLAQGAVGLVVSLLAALYLTRGR